MNKVKIVGLGPGDHSQLTLGALEIIKQAPLLILRTEKHPTVDYIRQLGITFTTCDDIYDTTETFDDTYEEISERVLAAAEKHQTVVYAVPGHPLVAEKSVSLILEKIKNSNTAEVEVIQAVSFIDAILGALHIDPIHGLKIIDGLSMPNQKPDTRCGNIITQVYDSLVASNTKLMLMGYYGDEYDIFVVKAAGVKGIERIEKIKLYELDRLDWLDYLTSIYIPPAQNNLPFKSMDDLIELMEALRAENGCPWDREQTRESLKPYLLEEAYEVLDAIEKNDLELLAEELGDLLLQVIFHCQIAKEEGDFDINDVTTGVVNKLIIRHPHVFGNVIATTESGALQSWEASKREQKGNQTYTQSLMNIPQALPNLMRSYKVQQKAALAGFDWEDVEGPLEKVIEEFNELKEVYKTGKNDIIEEEIGDLLFAVVNVSRFLKVQPELALRATIEKFIRRFSYIEETALQLGKKIDKMSLQEMDKLWERAKTQSFNKKS